MGQDIYFEFGAFVIATILTLCMCGKYSVIDFKDKIFSGAAKIVMVFTFIDILAYVAARMNMVRFHIFVQIVVALYFIFLGTFTYMLLLYFLSSIKKPNSTRHIGYAVAYIPNILVAIISIYGIFSGRIFYFSDNKVEFGPWISYMYIVPMAYLIACGIVAIVNSRAIKDKNAYVFYITPIIGMAALGIQCIDHQIYIAAAGAGVILLIIYVNFQIRLIAIDNLTKLPNAESFWNMLDYRIAQKKSMDIVNISLDEFRLVNQEFGQANGNKFIKAIADYIEEQSPKGCVARIGGDEFGVIISKNEHMDVMEWCNMISKRFESPWVIDNLKYTLSASISTLEYPTLADISDGIIALLEYTDSYIKRISKNSVLACDEEFKNKMYRRSKISSFLKKVIDEASMAVYYQPILDVEQGRFHMAEALFRLSDEELGNIPPFEFFPIAEEAGYVADIGYVLIDKVCKYIAGFRDKLEKLPTISVNFTRQQFLYEGVLEKVIGITNRYDIPTSCLAIEIPEEAFSHNKTKVIEQVKAFHTAGFKLYLDGFGTGFLNLSVVLSLPFELIKIDKHMMWEAEKNNAIYLLVSALTAVFNENGTKVLAEGIESDTLKDLADLLFMDYLQGYHFCQPMRSQETEEFFLREPDENITESKLDGLLDEIEDLEEFEEAMELEDDFKTMDEKYAEAIELEDDEI